MITRPQPRLVDRLLPWRRVLAATLVVAVFDAAFAFVVYVLIAGRYNFETLLQYIASGLTGPAAFSTGIAGIGYAALGFGIHLAISAGFVVVYALLIAPRVRTPATATVVGLLYGAMIWLFMNAVVLPLGRSAHEPFFNGYYIAFFLEHAVLVGLPIALILFGDNGSRATSVPSA
jgi:hypothetical protein